MTETATRTAPGAARRGAPPSAADDERRQLDRVRRELEREFAGRLPAPDVARQLEETVASFAGAPIRGFVPVLAQRRARAQLRRAVAGG